MSLSTELRWLKDRDRAATAQLVGPLKRTRRDEVARLLDRWVS